MDAFTFFIVPALSAGVFFWRRFGTAFNPPSLCAFSLGGAGLISVLFDALVREGYPIHAGFLASTRIMALVFLVGLLAFLAPWLNARRKPHSQGISVDRNMNRTLLQLDLLVLAVLIVTWSLLGGVPITEMLAGRISINDHLANLRSLPSGVMMINLAGVTALSLYVASRFVYPRISLSSKIIFGCSLLTVLIASGWQGNRQSFLIILFFIVARSFLKCTETYGKLPSARTIWLMRACTAISILIFIIGFTAINYIRLANEGRFSGPTELFLYYSWPVYNMVSISSHVGLQGTGDIMYLLTEILPARFGGKDLLQKIAPLLFEPTAPSGYFSYWYLSFGMIGVMIGSCLLGVASRIAFEMSTRSEYYLRIYLLMLWSCATVPVYSHFLSVAYFWIPLLALLIVHLCSRMTLVLTTEQKSSVLASRAIELHPVPETLS